MDNLKKALLKAIVHGLEVLIVLTAVWFLVTYTGIAETEYMPMVYAALATGLVKLVRAWDKSPVVDYVNDL